MKGKKFETKTGFGQNASPISTYCSHIPDLLTAKPFPESWFFVKALGRNLGQGKMVSVQLSLFSNASAGEEVQHDKCPGKSNKN